MSTSTQRDFLPPELPLAQASFYSCGSSVADISTGTRADYEYVAFDYNSQSGDCTHIETVVAIRSDLPKDPVTWLSRSSGVHLEKVGEWIFAFEVRRILDRREVSSFVD